MDSILASEFMALPYEVKKNKDDSERRLFEAEVDEEYKIKRVETDDDELRKFLFTLGCYEAEKLTVLSALGENFVISIKDARYSINLELAKAIII